MADLRLDEREAESLLAAAGVQLEPSELSELTERTEGWPAGLYLAALSLQAGGSSSASAAGFAGDDRFVSEYFRFELLSRLPVAEARFLQYSSVLDRMCGGLCDAVLQTPRSAQTLETLERTNGFVVPLDRRGEWYRYHHLFGELLRNELERSEPEMVPALNRRAMDWCIANDLHGGSDRLRPRRGRDGHRRRSVRRPVAPALLRRPQGDRRAVAGMVRRRRARALPGARRLRRLAARDDGSPRRGRAVARPRGRGDFGDSALGRLRHDRAVGRDAAGAHDARRSRAGDWPTPSWRWTSSPRQASGSRPRSSAEACHMPCSARPNGRRTT